MIDRTKPFAGVLNNWARIEYFDGIGYAGNIEQDVRERFLDGELIRTSEVVAEEDNYIETRNSIYVLGTERTRHNGL